MISVVLYGRKECHLCEQAQEDLNSLQEKIPHQLTVVDIDSNDDMNRAYALDIPVVEVGPYKLKAPFTIQELEVTLAAAVHRKQQLEDLQDPEYTKLVNRGKSWGKLDAFSYWLSKHYLALFNVSVFIYMAIPFLAPVFMKFNLVLPANIIYRGYKVVCHQLAYRSIFLFGEQPFYPRAAAGVNGIMTFQQATGLSESNFYEDIVSAQKYTGNKIVGFKVALCERDISIYAGILLFGLIFGVTGKRLPSLPWYLWIIIGLVPIGIDGTSQLLSQPPFNFIPYRESTPYLRIITGALFGISTAWFGYPLLEESMADTRKILAVKRLRLNNNAKNQVKASVK
jgi:uncharacterized membrane protein